MDDLTFTTFNAFLHHGIQGQKWGVQNGPPYPLGSNISTGHRLKTAIKNKKEEIVKNYRSKHSPIGPNKKKPDKMAEAIVERYRHDPDAHNGYLRGIKSHINWMDEEKHDNHIKNMKEKNELYKFMKDVDLIAKYDRAAKDPVDYRDSFFLHDSNGSDFAKAYTDSLVINSKNPNNAKLKITSETEDSFLNYAKDKKYTQEQIEDWMNEYDSVRDQIRADTFHYNNIILRGLEAGEYSNGQSINQHSLDRMYEMILYPEDMLH